MINTCFQGGGGETRNYIKTLIFAGVSMLSASGVFAEAKSVKLVCSGYTGSERLQNFQALVKLYKGCSYGFSYDDYAAKDGTDIWFTDSDGTLIPHEIDVWNPSGESFVWVKIPEIANNTTYITMHWGEARTAEQTCVATETWSNHVGVWHMNGTVVNGAPQNETDATGNGLDAVPECHPSGKATYLKNMTRASTSAVGYARVNKTTIQAYDTCGLKVPTYKDKGIVDDVTKFTLSGWFYWDGSNGKNEQTDTSDYLHLFSSQGTFTKNENNDNDQPALDTLPKDGRFNIQKNAGSAAIDVSVNGGSTKINIGNGTGSGQHQWANGWVHFVFVFDGTSGKVYRNGDILAQGTMGNCIAHSAYGFAIGCKGWRKSNAFRGKYDEVRMFDGVESADRIKADYATVNSPESFLEPPSPLPATAVWTGEAGDGDISNPRNWLCKNNLGIVLENVLPIASTDVTIEGTGLFINIASGETLQYATLSIGNCTLGANCDWRGLGADVMSHAAGKAIELNGFSLKVAGLTASATATIKNTATGSPADLTVDVASGETVNNRVSLTGNLKLVKDGAGWLATTIKQTYTGGTEVLQGTISPEKYTSSTSGPNGGPNGIWAYGQGKILVKKNGTFDVCGQLGYRCREVVLDGGTLASGGTGKSSVENYAGSGVTEILSDSHIAVTAKRLVFGGGYDTVPLSFKYTNLNGFTLDAAIATEMTIYGFAGPTNGTFKTSGAGTLKFGNEQHIMESTSFEVGCALNMGAAITVSNYVARYTGTANTGSAALKVKYVFKPETSGFYGCTMMAGSTMDFTAWPSAADASGWPVASKFTAGKKDISFEGGTVTVKLDETREDVKALARKKTDGSYSGYLLKWASAPSAEFSLDPVSNGRYRLVKDASGLLLTPRPGFAVIVR